MTRRKANPRLCSDNTAHGHGGGKSETTKSCKQRKVKSTEQTKIKVIQFTPNLSEGIKGNSQKDPFVGVITLVFVSLSFVSCGCN